MCEQLPASIVLRRLLLLSLLLTLFALGIVGLATMSEVSGAKWVLRVIGSVLLICMAVYSHLPIFSLSKYHLRALTSLLLLVWLYVFVYTLVLIIVDHERVDMPIDELGLETAELVLILLSIVLASDLARVLIFSAQFKSSHCDIVDPNTPPQQHQHQQRLQQVQPPTQAPSTWVTVGGTCNYTTSPPPPPPHPPAHLCMHPAYYNSYFPQSYPSNTTQLPPPAASNNMNVSKTKSSRNSKLYDDDDSAIASAPQPPPPPSLPPLPHDDLVSHQSNV